MSFCDEGSPGLVRNDDAVDGREDPVLEGAQVALLQLRLFTDALVALKFVSAEDYGAATQATRQHSGPGGTEIIRDV